MILLKHDMSIVDVSLFLEKETLNSLEASGQLAKENPRGFSTPNRYFYFYMGRFHLAKMLRAEGKWYSFTPSPDGKSHPGNFHVKWWWTEMQQITPSLTPKPKNKLVMIPHKMGRKFFRKEDIVVGMKMNGQDVGVHGWCYFEEMRDETNWCSDTGRMERSYKLELDALKPMNELLENLMDRWDPCAKGE